MKRSKADVLPAFNCSFTVDSHQKELVEVGMMMEMVVTRKMMEPRL